MYTVYAIRNEADQIYIGQTEDLKTRLSRHNGNLPSKKNSYTNLRRSGIWNVVYKEEFGTRTEAIKREKQLKTYQGRQFIKNLKLIRPGSSVGRATAF